MGLWRLVLLLLLSGFGSTSGELLRVANKLNVEAGESEIRLIETPRLIL